MGDRDTDVAVVRKLYRAVEAGDHPAIRRCLADDLRWRQAGSVVPAAGVDQLGADALLDRVVRPIEADWEGFSEELDEVIAGDGHVVVTGTYRGTHRRSGRELEAEFCHIWKVHGDRIRGFRQYTDTARFAEALDGGDGGDGGDGVTAKA